MKLSRRQFAQLGSGSLGARLLALGAASAPAFAAKATIFGTALRPFSAQSPWNSRPVEPVLGDFEIPKSDYAPGAIEGKWSTGVYIARDTDKPQRILGLVGQPGVWDPDAETHRNEVLLPRWPALVMPAEGSDGHADIVDEQAGLIHSFWQLRQVEGQWRAQQYAWTRLDGRGWGDPAHYFQGARAAGVPTMGGLIRRHEVADDQPYYRHALALSLTFNGLSAKPTFIFPATSADNNAASTNTGQIPEGALLMLPPDFDTSRIESLKLRKIAETLKRYGGYVVDRNHGTPFAVYVENGSAMKLHGALPWDNSVAQQLQRIRGALRQVVSASGWVDGHDRPVDLTQPLNLLSMRGTWKPEKGEAQGRFDTWQQALLIEPGGEQRVLLNIWGHNISSIDWARPQPGHRLRLKVVATGGARLRLQLLGKEGALLLDVGGTEGLGDGQSKRFEWPEGVRGTALRAITPASDRSAMLRGDLRLELP